jgi:ribosomal protein S21
LLTIQEIIEDKPASKNVDNSDKEKVLAEARKQYFIERQQAAEKNRQIIAEQMGLPVVKPLEVPKREKESVQEAPTPAPRPAKVDDKEQLLAEARKQYFVEKQQAAERNKNIILEQKGLTPAQASM